MRHRTKFLDVVFAIIALLTLPREIATAQFPINEWNQPFPPFRIIGNIHYVGTSNLACYIIKTNAGLILLDTAMQESAPIVRANIEALGFKERKLNNDARIINHGAHGEHRERPGKNGIVPSVPSVCSVVHLA